MLFEIPYPILEFVSWHRLGGRNQELSEKILNILQKLNSKSLLYATIRALLFKIEVND
jgi:hypothetical protein